jgi:hypothetical protein
LIAGEVSTSSADCSEWVVSVAGFLVRACGITHHTPKRILTTLHNPSTLFLSIKLLRKHLNSNLLSFIFILLYFLRIEKYFRPVFKELLW